MSTSLLLLKKEHQYVGFLLRYSEHFHLRLFMKRIVMEEVKATISERKKLRAVAEKKATI